MHPVERMCRIVRPVMSVLTRGLPSCRFRQTCNRNYRTCHLNSTSLCMASRSVHVWHKITVGTWLVSSHTNDTTYNTQEHMRASVCVLSCTLVVVPFTVKRANTHTRTHSLFKYNREMFKSEMTLHTTPYNIKVFPGPRVRN